MDSLYDYLSIEILQKLETRLGQTLYNNPTDRPIVWAYFRGINDAVIGKEDHRIRVVIEPSIAQPAVSIQPTSPTPILPRTKRASLNAVRKDEKKKVTKAARDRATEVLNKKRR